MKDYKFQLYCGSCQKDIGYTNHHFKIGEPLNAHDIVWPDGKQSKPGEQIGCGCDQASIRLRANPDYQEKCPRCFRGGLAFLTIAEKTKAEVDIKAAYIGCDECSYLEEV